MKYIATNARRRPTHAGEGFVRRMLVVDPTTRLLLFLLLSLLLQAKDLVRRMLVVDPTKRLTAQQCLEHEWIVSWLLNYDCHVGVDDCLVC